MKNDNAIDLILFEYILDDPFLKTHTKINNFQRIGDTNGLFLILYEYRGSDV